jgi:hypothetical protein
MLRSPTLMPRSSGHSLPLAPWTASILVSLASAALSGGTAALLLARHSLRAGVLALLSAALLVAVARPPGAAESPGVPSTEARGGARRSQFGRRVSSAIFEASILLPLAWLGRAGSARVTLLAQVGLGASYLVSYQLARGESLGYRGWESAAYRIATASLLVVAVFAGPVGTAQLEASLWLFAALVVSAAVRRAWDVARQERPHAASLEARK